MLSTTRDDNALIVSVSIVAVLTIALHVAGALAAQMWGVHFYAFYHPAVLAIAALATIAACAVVIVRRDAVAGSAKTPSGRMATILMVVTVAAAFSVFWMFRTRHSYLGDGNVILTNVPAGHVFNPRQPLAGLTQHTIYRVAGPMFGAGERPAEDVTMDALAMGSAVLGVLFVVAAWFLAQELSRLATRKPKPSPVLTTAVWAVLVTQGYMQLFFGYVENYAFHTVLLAVYLWAAIRHLRGALPLFVPLLVAIVAVAFHLSAAIVLPSAGVLFVLALLRPRQRLRALAQAAGAAAVLVALQLALALADPGYRFATSLIEIARLALSRGQEVVPNYLTSAMHVRDFANEQLLIGPLGLVFFIVALVVLFIRRTRWDGTVIFLVVVGATYAGAAWLAGDSNLGYARNWDLLAAGGLLCTAAGLGLFFQSGDKPRSAIAALLCAVFISLFHTAPWVATNASASRSLERLKVLPLGLGRTEMLVGKWFIQEGDLDTARTWLERAIAANPRNNNAYHMLGTVLYDIGETSAAADAFARAADLRPDKALFREHLVRALMESGREAEAVAPIEWLIEHQTSPGMGLFIQYGDALTAAGREADARAAFERALAIHEEAWRRNPDGASENYWYGIILGRMGRYDDALPYFMKAVEAEPQWSAALYYTGYILRLEDRDAEAAEYFERCLAADPNHWDRDRMRGWIDAAE